MKKKYKKKVSEEQVRLKQSCTKLGEVTFVRGSEIRDHESQVVDIRPTDCIIL